MIFFTEISAMIYRNFYSEVGKLMYSIASIDGKVNRKEYEKLRDIVEKKLVPMESSTDSFGTDAAYYAEIEFDILQDEELDPQWCFDSFVNYVDTHKTAFDTKLKKMVMNLSKELSAVYHGTNKKEAALIHKLQMELNKIFPS